MASGAIVGVDNVARDVAPSALPAAAASYASALGGDSKSDEIVANTTSGVHGGCPDTPVIARLLAPRSPIVAGTAAPNVPVAANSGPIRAFSIGRAASNTAHALPPAPAVPLASATALRYLPMRLPQHPPELIAALCLLSAAVSHGEPDPDPAVEEDIQAKFKRIKSTMNALFTGAAVPHNGCPVTSPPPSESEDDDYEEVDVEQEALQMYADRPEDPWNVEDPDFDNRLYVEERLPKWRVGLLL